MVKIRKFALLFTIGSIKFSVLVFFEVQSISAIHFFNTTFTIYGCVHRIIIQPKWDQNTYVGRMKYFFCVTNPLNIFQSNEDLDKAKEIIDTYNYGQSLSKISMENIHKAKHIYESAFHPETGEKMHILGRMSAQVPMNMTITGCMLAFYKSTPAVIFWQWFNQSFNALVNYTNRSGSSDMPTEKLLQAYVCATSGALITALSLNKLAKKSSSPLFRRFVPFVAVSAANCVNIPMMRYKELEEGIKICDENNRELGQSKVAAVHAIFMVVISRILMSAPGMLLTPLIMEGTEKTKFLQKNLWLSTLLQITLTGLFLTFSTPMACALFPQKCSISVEKLENTIQERACKLVPVPNVGYYNKGL